MFQFIAQNTVQEQARVVWIEPLVLSSELVVASAVKACYHGSELLGSNSMFSPV